MRKHFFQFGQDSTRIFFASNNPEAQHREPEDLILLKNSLGKVIYTFKYKFYIM